MTIIYIPEDRIGSDETLARLIDRLQDAELAKDMTGSFPVVEVATGERADMTNQAREATEGDTMRRELAQGLCQSTWRDHPHVNIRPDDATVYRQHRCGRQGPHAGACRCRYCGRDRSAA